MIESNNSVWKLIKDLEKKKGITEIVINGPDVIFVERDGQFIQLSVSTTLDDINSFIQDVSLMNREECSFRVPLFNGSLSDGSRINIVHPPYVSGAPAITIRKFLKNFKSFDQDPSIFGLDEFWINFFKSIVSAHTNILVSGGTGVGKTTFLNMLLSEVSLAERIISIEDVLELEINNPNTVRLEAGMKTTQNMKGALEVTVRELVKNTLRMRPDRIIIGEVRGEELFDLLQAMNTGHDGSMSSVHANSPRECFSRIESLFLLSGHDIPIVAVRRQISDALDFIIQLGRDSEGRRVVHSIEEVIGMEGPIITSQTIGQFKDEKLVKTGVVPRSMEKLHRMGGLPMDFFK